MNSVILKRDCDECQRLIEFCPTNEVLWQFGAESYLKFPRPPGFAGWFRDRFLCGFCSKTES